MSVEPYSLDANVLFYALDRSAGEKHHIAVQLWMGLRKGPSMLTVQTLAETYWSIHRKQPSVTKEARALFTQLANYISIVAAQQTDLFDAMAMHGTRPVHFWDAVLACTLRRNGCRILLTEDAQDRPVSDGLRYLNPFTVPESELQNFLPE